MIRGKLWLLHRLIYIYHFKEIRDTIDHIDRDPLNNNIENLQDVSRSINQENRCRPSNNTSGIKGINPDRRRNTWNVEITINGNRTRKSGFKTQEEAIEFLRKLG